MKNFTTNNEFFSLRVGEVIEINSERPDAGRWFALSLVQMTMPEGPRRSHNAEGKSVESCAIVAAEFLNGAWQWLHLSPATKAVIADLTFDDPKDKWPRDCWLYAIVYPRPIPKEYP